LRTNRLRRADRNDAMDVLSIELIDDDITVLMSALLFGAVSGRYHSGRGKIHGFARCHTRARGSVYVDDDCLI